MLGGSRLIQRRGGRLLVLARVGSRPIQQHGGNLLVVDAVVDTNLAEKLRNELHCSGRSKKVRGSSDGITTHGTTRKGGGEPALVRSCII
jgi:hypothetical protein